MTQPKMTAPALIDAIANTSGFRAAAVRAILSALSSETQAALTNGQSVTIPGIAALTPRDRPARIGRNPRTGEPAQIPAKRVATARVLPALTKALN